MKKIATDQFNNQFTQLLTSLQTTPTHLSLVTIGPPLLSSSSTVGCYAIFGLQPLRKRVWSITKDQDLFSKEEAGQLCSHPALPTRWNAHCPLQHFMSMMVTQRAAREHQNPCLLFGSPCTSHLHSLDSKARHLFTNSLHFLIHGTFKLTCNFS